MNSETHNDWKTTYCIAEVHLSIDCPFPLVDSVNAASFYSGDDYADFSLHFKEIDSFTDMIDEYEVVEEGNTESILVCNGKEYRNYTYDSASYAITTLDGNCGFCYYEYPDVLFDMTKNFRKPLTFCCLERIMLRFDRIILHSSHINYRGDSIVISAPSGTGKSTHAALWEKYYGATIVNGDRSIIGRKRDGKKAYYAYGLPMCGSSDIYKNISGPLKAIVIIRQSPDNHVRRAAAMEAFRYIFSETTQNVWNQDFMDHLMNLIEDIVSAVPVYILHCNMEKSAADCLHKAIYDQDL